MKHYWPEVSERPEAKKFKAAEFLRDIGLDLHVKMLEETIAGTSNVYQLSIATVDAEVAVMRVIDNLAATYGQKTIYDILSKLK